MPDRIGTVREWAATLQVAIAVAAHPELWAVVARLAPPGWWRRWPPRPWPPKEYLRFRSETMYGEERGRLRAGDVIDYLRWCRRMGHQAR